MDACIAGDLDTLETILEFNPDIISLHPDLIEYVASNGKADCMGVLIDRGVNIEIINDALYKAAQNGHTETVKVLLGAKGIEVNAKAVDGLTALHIAAHEGRTETVEVLLRADGIEVNEVDNTGATPLHRAAKNGNAECMGLLIKENADVDAADDFGNTPVHYAAMNKYSGCIFILFNDKADMHKPNHEGKTPFDLAIDNGFKWFKLLQGSGGLKSSSKEMLEHLCNAAYCGKARALKKLIFKAEADIIDKKSERDGKMALHHAAEGGSVECVKILLGNGAEINAVDRYGNTPLQIAAHSGHKEIIALLIQRRADTACVDKDGRTLLHIIAARDEITWLDLFDTTKQINSPDKNGNTPLHIAARNGFNELLEKLVDIEGADITVQNKAGETPWASAAKKVKLDCCKLLRQKTLRCR
nr:ankyrin repeat domain-containing protein [Endozoicomonas sp. ONNA2]